MLTVHEDERQKAVALRAGYHGFIAAFVTSVALAGVGVFILDDLTLSITALGLVLVAIVVYYVSLWRGGWFEYVREVTNRTAAERARARRQVLLSFGAMAVWLFIWGYYLDGRSLQRSVLGSLVSTAITGALFWWLHLRRLPSD